LIIACLGLRVRGRANSPRTDYHPSVTVFIPTFDEEKQISRKLVEISRQTYSPTEILIIDCSTDSTPEIVEDYKRDHPSIRLIRQAQRTGMAKTLNEAVDLAQGEILVYTGCDSSTGSASALENLISHFSDPKVGGVTGICANSGLEGQFRKFTNWIQNAESNIDSTIIAHGGPSMMAFRRSIAQPVRSDSLADDTEMFVNIRRKGFRTILDTRVVSSEVLPDSFKARRMQKDRRARGIIQVLFQNIDLAFNPRYGFYGLVVFPMDLFLLVASPFIILLDTALLGYFLFTINPLSTLVLFTIVGLSLLSTKVRALVDIQLSGLIGSLSAASGRGSNLWPKEQLRPRVIASR